MKALFRHSSWLILVAIAALSSVATLYAIDTSSALYTANIQFLNLGLTRSNFAMSQQVSGSALIDDAFMESDALNAVMHEGPVQVPSMPANNRIILQDFVIDDGGVFSDYQTEVQNSTELDVPLLPPTPAVGDAAYFACDNPCRILTIDVGQEGVGDWELLWEYFDGTAFVTASNVTDLTQAFTRAGQRTVSFEMPSDFATTTITGAAVGDTYWVRARVTDVSTSSQQAIANQSWYENGQWWAWGRSLSINEEILYNLSVGGPDLVTNHQIFPGDAGIVTPDDSSVELGDTYAIHWEGALKFSEGVTGSNVCVVCKPGAITLTVTDVDPNELTLAITGASTTTLTLSGIPDATATTSETVAPHKVDVISDGTDLTFSLEGVGTAGGTARTVVDNSNDWEWMSNGAAVYANQIYVLPDETAAATDLFDTETQWDTGTLTDIVSTGGQPGLTLKHLSVASADDGRWTEGTSTFNNTDTFTQFGYQGTGGQTSVNSFYRFQGLPITQGQDILSAKLVIAPLTNDTNTTVNVAISAIDEDDADAPSSFAEAEGETRTTASVDWDDVPGFSVNTSQDSPDITTVIQEIVDRAGWQSGNAMVILVEDNGSTTSSGTTRFPCTFEAYCDAVRLEVTLDTGETFTDDFIEMEATARSSSNSGNIEGWAQGCSGSGCSSRVISVDAGAGGSRTRYGANAMRVRAGTAVGTSAAIDQDFDATAGETYSFAIDAVRTAADTDTATFHITFRDSPGGTVLQTETANIPVDTNNYQTISIDGVDAPAGTESVRFRVQITCGSSCGAASGVWFDGARACICASAPTFPTGLNQLTNPSFEQVYEDTANWVSSAINLTQTDVASSNILWTDLEPFGATTTVETSLDSGATWTEATNGEGIPGVSEGDDVSGETLLIRVTMTPSTDADQVFSPFTSFLAVLVVDDVLEDSALLFYELRTTPGVTIEDLSPNSNDGTMSYPVQLSGIFSSMTPFRSNRTPLSQDAAIGVGDFAASAPITGADSMNLFGQDTGEHLPGGGVVNAAADSSRFPVEAFWVAIILLGGIGVGAVVWRFTEGSRLATSFVLAGASVLAAVVGDGVLSGWVPFVVIIILTAYNILRSRLPIF